MFKITFFNFLYVLNFLICLFLVQKMKLIVYLHFFHFSNIEKLDEKEKDFLTRKIYIESARRILINIFQGAFEPTIIFFGMSA